MFEEQRMVLEKKQHGSIYKKNVQFFYPRAMVPEDHFPLLYLQSENEPEPAGSRSRKVARGAAEILSRWPDHASFNWLLAFIGLVIVFVCFLIIIATLLIATYESNSNELQLINECRKKEAEVGIFSYGTFQNLLNEENATFIIQNPDSEINVEEIEPYVRNESSTFLITRENFNSTVCQKLENRFENFRSILFEPSLLKGTVFEDVHKQIPETFDLLIKILVAWNFGGLVIDSGLKRNDVERLETAVDDGIAIGMADCEVALISSRRHCHAFLFEVMKILSDANNFDYENDFQVVKTAYGRFCKNSQNCTGVDVVSIFGDDRKLKSELIKPENDRKKSA